MFYWNENTPSNVKIRPGVSGNCRKARQCFSASSEVPYGWTVGGSNNFGESEPFPKKMVI